MSMRWSAYVLGIGCLFATVASPVARSTSVSTSLTAAGAREDLELAIAAVEAALPNLYWHQSRRAWASAKTLARTRVGAVTDSESLWRVLRPLLAQIGEGHLGVQVSDGMKEHYRDALRFPLDVLWTDKGAFVLAGYGTAADVVTGTRLVSVDGRSDDALLDEMVAISPHDGVIRTGVMRDLSGRGFAQDLYRLRGPLTHYRVVLEGPGGRTMRDLAAVPRLARPAETDDPSPLPTLAWLDDHTAYLDVPTFSNKRLRASGAAFPEAIHTVFEQIAQHGTRDLILDLRQNGGGSEPNESILFSYLVEKPLHKYAAVDARARHIAVTSLSGKRFDVDVFAEEDDAQRPLPGGRWTRRNTPPHGLMSRWTTFAPVFHGRVVVLAGGNTFSGGAEVASMLRHTDRAVFVGEEVGGADEGNTSGYRWNLALPNSRMTITIPLLQFRMAWAAPAGRGVLPDCPVPPDATEVDEPRDHAQRVAVALLQQDWRVPGNARCPDT